MYASNRPIAIIKKSLTDRSPTHLRQIRLAKLERRCRVLTIALAAAVLLPAVALLAGAGQLPNEAPLRLRQLEIIDANGNARMRLGPLNDEFGIFMRDPAGQPLVSLSDSPEATLLNISKEGGSIRLLANRLGADVTLRDGKNNVRAVATATQADEQPRAGRSARPRPARPLAERRGPRADVSPVAL